MPPLEPLTEPGDELVQVDYTMFAYRRADLGRGTIVTAEWLAKGAT